MKTTLTKICTISALLVSFAGCALLTCDVKGLHDIEKAYTRTFDKDPGRCYELTAKAMHEWDAVVFQQKKNDYIVGMEFEKIFASCINTTEVGIFFTSSAPHKTEVKVTSLNYNLSQFVSLKLFDYIDKDGKMSKEAGVSDAGTPADKP